MHRQDLRLSTNSSFSGIVNWQEHIKIDAYCWRKYNWEGSLEHLTCFCPKSNAFWAKITKVMTKNYIQSWERCFPSSRVTMGTGNFCEQRKRLKEGLKHLNPTFPKAFQQHCIPMCCARYDTSQQLKVALSAKCNYFLSPLPHEGCQPGFSI